MIYSGKIKGELFLFINFSVSYFKFIFRLFCFSYQFDVYVINYRFLDYDLDD